jgi:hypothetical protein
VTLSIELCNFLHKTLYLAICLFAELHDGTLLGQVDFLLIEMFFELAPASTLALLFVVHFTLFSLVLCRKVSQLFVKMVDFLVNLNLVLVVISIVRLLALSLWHAWNLSLQSDIDFLAEVAPLSSHKFLVFGPVCTFWGIWGVLFLLARAIDLLAYADRFLTFATSATTCR